MLGPLTDQLVAVRTALRADLTGAVTDALAAARAARTDADRARCDR